MNVIIPLGLFLTLLCFIYRRNVKYYMPFAISFLIMAVLMAIRYNFGEDYITYSTLYDTLQVQDVSNWEGGKMEYLYVRFLERFPSYEIYIALQTVAWFGLMQSAKDSHSNNILTDCANRLHNNAVLLQPKTKRYGV